MQFSSNSSLLHLRLIIIRYSNIRKIFLYYLLFYILYVCFFAQTYLLQVNIKVLFTCLLSDRFHSNNVGFSF